MNNDDNIYYDFPDLIDSNIFDKLQSDKNNCDKAFYEYEGIIERNQEDDRLLSYYESITLNDMKVDDTKIEELKKAINDIFDIDNQEDLSQIKNEYLDKEPKEEICKNKHKLTFEDNHINKTSEDKNEIKSHSPPYESYKNNREEYCSYKINSKESTIKNEYHSENEQISQNYRTEFTFKHKNSIQIDDKNKLSEDMFWDLTTDNKILAYIGEISVELNKHAKVFVDPKTNKHLDAILFFKKLKIYPLYVQSESYSYYKQTKNSDEALNGLLSFKSHINNRFKIYNSKLCTSFLFYLFIIVIKCLKVDINISQELLPYYRLMFFYNRIQDMYPVFKTQIKIFNKITIINKKGENSKKVIKNNLLNNKPLKMLFEDICWVSSAKTNIREFILKPVQFIAGATDMLKTNISLYFNIKNKDKKFNFSELLRLIKKEKIEDLNILIQKSKYYENKIYRKEKIMEQLKKYYTSENFANSHKKFYNKLFKLFKLISKNQKIFFEDFLLFFKNNSDRFCFSIQKAKSYFKLAQDIMFSQYNKDSYNNVAALDIKGFGIFIVLLQNQFTTIKDKN